MGCRGRQRARTGWTAGTHLPFDGWLRREPSITMFVWHKRSGEPSKVRFLWWPLLLSLALSVLLTIMLNTIL